MSPISRKSSKSKKRSTTRTLENCETCSTDENNVRDIPDPKRPRLLHPAALPSLLHLCRNLRLLLRRHCCHLHPTPVPPTRLLPGPYNKRVEYYVQHRKPRVRKERRPMDAKKREYVERVTEVEHGSFTPLVFSSCGGAGAEATIAIKRIASLLAAKRRESYSKIISWMRCSLAFSLARSAIRCLRGSRSIRRRAREFAPIDLVSTEASIRPL